MAALKLMTYMVAQGSQPLREFAATFDFTIKGFRAAAHKRNRKVSLLASKQCYIL